MSTLSALLAQHTDLPGAAVDHLQRVVGEWQLLADLSFADVLLWVNAEPSDIVCVAQCRPTTASTVLPEDSVGTIVSEDEHPYVRKAFESGKIVVADVDPNDPVPLRRQAVPVRWDGKVIAVLSRDAARVSRRSTSALETAYLECADALYRMICEGTFPTPESRSDTKSSPRAGDGFIRLDREGRVVYASPNALSAYHRMGLNSDLVGQDLIETTRALVTDPFESGDVADYLSGAVQGRIGQRMEIEARGATVLLRALVLAPGGRLEGAAVVIRDVTEVKRRDRALLSKDATIREIHHRVKNNLQTVAALLRLQARRTGNAEAQQALGEAVRRVTSIALVHEALSMSVDEEVDLDDVVDRLIPIVIDVATVGNQIRVRREGSLGVFPADRATPLVMVLTELVQNSVEHAFEPGAHGTVTLRADRSARWLDVVVHDDGKGLPEGFVLEEADRLGLQIVRTLVAAELGGTLRLERGESGGTDAHLRLPLGRVPVN
ncbi:histidine kinase N-terminal domain-containing protein [Rhodococcus sp. HM1]|uniref:sensor histidine kinase n=1 Tax=unclassified Rhodococcus (in: high G+C Gram-positive bacteria) TaxID=192944 RepID=UPI0018CFCB58|nr:MULTISPECIES: histidine kinase N-terminal domain-containing protein [unclassified Rhodococcus (in: high G+C Gram-positive bacteria)]MBH0120871.1 histidine kinase N-terminal domain-containing protein [Rhodococcus sp. CX]MCK8670099.1 histidine kinase N-terminal domain-containing protein [Rhodococcus sp. HM1]